MHFSAPKLCRSPTKCNGLYFDSQSVPLRHQNIKNLSKYDTQIFQFIYATKRLNESNLTIIARLKGKQDSVHNMSLEIGFAITSNRTLLYLS